MIVVLYGFKIRTQSENGMTNGAFDRNRFFCLAQIIQKLMKSVKICVNRFIRESFGGTQKFASFEGDHFWKLYLLEQEIISNIVFHLKQH